ncbi:MAG: hypothetical protein WBA89_06615 [Microcoleus sp.]|uniref:hypothetical protein n=1 Tax=Microcoleus sp. TaxID=44472 RepID=UPI003C757A54
MLYFALVRTKYISNGSRKIYLSSVGEGIAVSLPQNNQFSSVKDVTIPGLILGKWRVQFPDGSTLRRGLGATFNS